MQKTHLNCCPEREKNEKKMINFRGNACRQKCQSTNNIGFKFRGISIDSSFDEFPVFYVEGIPEISF